MATTDNDHVHVIVWQYHNDDPTKQEANAFLKAIEAQARLKFALSLIKSIAMLIRLGCVSNLQKSLVINNAKF